MSEDDNKTSKPMRLFGEVCAMIVIGAVAFASIGLAVKVWLWVLVP